MNIKQWIQQTLLTDSGKIKTKRISKQWIDSNGFSSYYDSIINLTLFLSDDCKFSERIYNILHDKTEKTKCKNCEMDVKFLNSVKGYNEFCSIKCGYAFNTDKRRQTCLKKYGNETYTNKEKFKTTCKEKYGVDNPSKLKETRIKAKETCLEKYGDDKYNNQEKSKRTCLKKYGVEYSLQASKIKEKSKRTCLKKYGVEYYNQSQLFRITKNIELLTPEYITRNFIDENGYLDYKEFQDFFNCCTNHVYYLLDKLNISFTKRKGESLEEKEIISFINELSDKCITNDRQTIPPYELDVYLPDKNLAIEYNGIYWHSELQGKDKNYHLNKTKMCEEKGIQLLHVFDYQWIDDCKKSIIKSMIKSKFGISKRIYARNCILKEISTDVKDVFLDNNHLQGACSSSINFGLYFNDSLVNVMTFSVSRFNKNVKWELVRFCNKINLTVVGGASKLLKHFKNNYGGSIVSYADKTYSNGNLYEVLGFKMVALNPPSYKYFKKMYVISKRLARKNCIESLLETYDPKLTEWENMTNNGWNRFWDCGTIRYILN